MRDFKMLNNSAIAVIKSTVPVLETKGTAITKRFYELLFAGHPELLNVFNHANQKQGRQQAALANAVYAAAAHIDRLHEILPAVRQIAHKHRSLGIKPEHYPIVGETLLAAIKDVLGDAATDEILAAWAEAYGVIADAFIGVEAGMYREAEAQPGGWAGFRPFTIRRRVKESGAITSFYLSPADGGPLASFKPGQYVSVKADIPGQANTHIRQYSLSDAPGKPHYRISVKRETHAGERPDGIVSNYLHDSAGEGDTLLLSAPAGDFVLDESHPLRPVVLLSGGVGLTPMMSMLLHLTAAQSERPVTFIHAAANGRVHAFREDVRRIAERCSRVRAYFCYSEPTDEDRAGGVFDKEGRIDLPWLQTIVPSPDADFYFCGPVSFMQRIYRDLRGLGAAPSDIRYEFFGPSGSLDA
ncbi:NO-inducible flavohemoprotein [Paenibacillus humicola]|uniref:NO-inducible flavohemoprotein n=1 Tax=Paenibacillus humicola TaxID=3110540 RepID=UPI003B8388AE